MLTPIIMLVLMTAPYAFSRLLEAGGGRAFDRRAAAAAGLGLVFILTGVGHFAQTATMAQMLPPWVPERMLLIQLSGLLEFVIAAGFFVPRFRTLAAQCAITVLILFFPANIYAALNQIPLGGHAWGPVYLLIRAPLQLALVAWAYWFVIAYSNRRAASVA